MMRGTRDPRIVVVEHDPEAHGVNLSPMLAVGQNGLSATVCAAMEGRPCFGYA